MTHEIHDGKLVNVYRHLTSITRLDRLEDEYIALVQNEDVVDVWSLSDRVRGCNELVNYYEKWYDRQINEQDIRIFIRSQ